MTRFLLLLLAMFLVSTAALFAHRALAEATPLAIAAWRLGLAAVFFLGWDGVQRVQESPAVLPRSVTVRLAFAGLCLAGHFVTWFAALQYTSIARATLLACTTPLWTTLGGALLGRGRFTGVHALALALAAVGMGFVTQISVQAPTHMGFRGDLLATSAGMLFAGYLLLVEGLHVVLSARRQVTLTYSVAALVLWLGFLVQGGITLSYSRGVWLALLGMTLGPQILGHTLLNALLRLVPSSTIAFAILLEPVLAAGLAFALLHQTIIPGQIFGGGLVLAALTLVIARQTSPVRVPAEPPG